MSEVPHPETIAATPEDAEALYDWAASTAEMRGEYYYHCDGFGEIELAEVPAKVAEHFPIPDPFSQAVHHTLYVSRQRDLLTREPATEGTVANVLFRHKEHMDDDLIYITDVDYHITNDGAGYFDLERHVSLNEFGVRRAAESGPNVGLPLTPDFFMSLLEESEQLRASTVAARIIERELGLFEVESEEALQIIEACRSL